MSFLFTGSVLDTYNVWTLYWLFLRHSCMPWIFIKHLFIERQRKNGSLPKCWQRLRLGQSRSHELGTPSMFTTWVAGTQLIKPSLLPPRVCISGKLESGTGLGLKPRHPEKGCKCPKWWLNCYPNIFSTTVLVCVLYMALQMATVKAEIVNTLIHT